MAAFIALKPCRFGTVDYGRGDTIPAETITPSRTAVLIRTGYIARVTETPPTVNETTEPLPEPQKTKKTRTTKKQVI